jgi:hypothetical protein
MPKHTKRLYFGHPINSYGTDIEKKLLRYISIMFRGWEIENPNQELHQKKYEQWKKKTGNGMDDYFLKRVLPNCQGGVFLPFHDGAFGAEVYAEAKFLAKQNFRIWTISPEGVTTRFDLSKHSPLSTEETFARTRNIRGKIISYY